MVSFLVLVGIIIVFGVLFYRVMASFLLPLFLACVLVVMFRPLHNLYLRRFPDKTRLAALLTTVTTVLVVMIPVSVTVALAAVETSSLLTKINSRDISKKVAKLRKSLGLEMPCIEEERYLQTSLDAIISQPPGTATLSESCLDNLMGAVNELEIKVQNLGHSDKVHFLTEMQAFLGSAKDSASGSLEFHRAMSHAAAQFHEFRLALAGGGFEYRLKLFANPSNAEVAELTGQFVTGAKGYLPSLGGATGAFVFDLALGCIIMAVAVFFFLSDGPRMASTLMRLSPLDDAYERELFAEFDQVSRAVVLATLLSAVVQGLLAGAGFFVAGIEPVFLLMVLTTVLALIPFVGAAAVWVPVSFWLFFAEERYLAAVLMAVYGAAIISAADNIVKPLILHGQSKLHPLLALLSVLGGVQALGPVGIIVGPMVVVFLQALLNILHKELTSLEPRPVRKRRQEALPFILSLRLRGLRLPYAPPKTDRQHFLKERAE
jgi:predicted PurR-regulated permease PerM